MKYLKDSLNKFKSDILSKVLYDLMKYLFFFFISIAILKFIPIAKEILALDISMSIWSLLTLSLLLTGISFIILFVLFNKKHKKIQAQSRIDDLTGLKNYKALELDLDALEKDRNNNESFVSIILFDIDDFKKFNDDNSYEIADRILTKLGGLLSKDSRITDETYRYFMRGDEFLIIAKQTSISNAKIAADRKRTLIADSSFEIDGTHFKLTVSCGVTEYSKGELKANVLDRATKALQKAKKNQNKNCTEVII